MHVADQLDVVAQGFPERLELRDALAHRPGRFQHFALVGQSPADELPAVLHPGLRLGDQFLGRPVAAAMGIADDPVPAPAAEQFVHRNAERFSVDVPEGDVDRADRGGEGVGAGEEVAPEHHLPQVFPAGRILADEAFAEGEDDLPDGQLAPGQAAFAYAVDPFVRLDLDEEIVPVAAADREDFYVGNAHGNRELARRAYSSGSKSREAEFMQYRRPVGLGPSVNTWPRWESHRLHNTSVRIMP